jgi:hypothetical protein
MANFISDVWMQTAVVYFEIYAPESVIKATVMASECLKGWFYEPENEDDDDLVIKLDHSTSCSQIGNNSPVASTSPQWNDTIIKRRYSTEQNLWSRHSSANYSKSNSY